MYRNKNHLIKFIHAKIGGGGLHCECCTPKGKGRKLFIRLLKKTYRQRMRKEIQQMLQE